MKNKHRKIMLIAIALNFALSAAFAALPKNCTDEIVALSKGNGFDMQKFITDLPPAVAKAKVQAKVPFGKPKDNDKTSVGITFGCLKAFPESPAEIQSSLKDISMEIAKGAVANQLDANVQGVQSQVQPQQVQQQPQYQQQQIQPQQVQPQYQSQQEILVQPQYQQQQIQVQPQYLPQQVPQYQYPPQQVQPQYQPQQVQQLPPQYLPPPQYIYLYPAQQMQPTKCNCEKSDNFSAGERWGTWALNTFIPLGLGSGIIMGDYFGMGFQMLLNGSGILLAGAGAGGEEELGIALLGLSFIYNIVRSATYDKPLKQYSSNNDGFNLAVLQNQHGEAMPYLMYNKTF